jgi:23S rRNA (cytosine1962-C5)-methyltransferase
MLRRTKNQEPRARIEEFVIWTKVYEIKIFEIAVYSKTIQMIETLTPTYFTDYELIDSGNFEKLERFGQYTVARPEPQAIWDKALSEHDWQRLANAYFKRDKKEKSDNFDSNEKGEWIIKKGMPGQWFVNYNYKQMQLKMRLGMTSFKHVGIFPEQAENWNFIFDTIRANSSNENNVLNLFAYTGGASIAAKFAGASVTHVDSVKQVVSWSRENMEASDLKDIRWIVEDAMKFVQREVRRGNMYSGIILDPPAYGRGTDGEKWVLEKSLNELLKNCKQILRPKNSFVLLNLYSMGFSALVAESLIKTVFNNQGKVSSGELYVVDKAERKLALGIFVRLEL